MVPPAPNLKYKCEVVVPICILHEPGPSKCPMNDLLAVLRVMIEEVERITKSLTGLIDDPEVLPEATDFLLLNRRATFQLPQTSPDRDEET